MTGVSSREESGPEADEPAGGAGNRGDYAICCGGSQLIPRSHARSMQPEQLHTLSEQLGIPAFPQPWVSLQLDFPAALRTLQRGDGSTVDEFELTDDLELLLQLNQEVRLEPIPDGEGLALTWPENLLVIGENGAGDYYCIDINEPDPHVLFFDHHTLDLFDIDETLEGFVEVLIEQFGADDQDINPS